MSDPLRTDVSRTLDSTADSEREATIERLLLGGLDHYFAGEYEQAIDVWSRAFFLDPCTIDRTFGFSWFPWRSEPSRIGVLV